MFTLSNALRHGYWPAFGGMLGLGVGAVLVAAISATGLGLLLATSPTAFAALKYAGALYLVYLAWTLWLAPPQHRARPGRWTRRASPRASARGC